MLQRWTFFDPYLADTLVMAINPKEGGEPQRKKNVSTLTTTAGHNIHYEGARSPQEVSCTGVVLTTGQRDDLQAWANKPYQVELTNDMGETTWVWIDIFTPTRKRVSSRRYKAEYQLHAFVLDIP